VAVRALVVTALLGGAIAGLVIALPGSNHPGGAKGPGAVSTTSPAATGSPLNVTAVSGTLRKSLPFAEPPGSVAFAPDGTTLAVGTVSPGYAFNPSEPGAAYLVNTSTWSESTVYDASYSRGVSTVTFAQGDILATGDANGEAYAWDIKPPRVRPDYPDPQNGTVTAIAGAPKGSVAVLEVSKDIYLWSPARNEIAGPYDDPNTENVAAIAISPDGGTLVTADGNRTVYVWNTGDLKAGPDEQSGNSLLNTSVTSLAVAPGGRDVAIAGGEDAYLWDPVSGKLTTLTGPSGQSVNSMAFSPSGDLLAVGDSNGKTYLWDVAAPHQTPLTDVSDPASKSVASVAFGPDGTTLATADSDGYVYFWQLTTKSG
jgi:WD40 repeat protein